MIFFYSEKKKISTAAQKHQKKDIANPCDVFVLRKGRDSNPRSAFNAYSLSRRASSTTRAPFRIINFQSFTKKTAHFAVTISICKDTTFFITGKKNYSEAKIKPSNKPTCMQTGCIYSAAHPTPPRPAEGEKQMLNWAYPYQSPLA